MPQPASLAPACADLLPHQRPSTPFVACSPLAEAGRGSLPRIDDLSPEARKAVEAGQKLYADSIESLVRPCSWHANLHRV